MAQTYLVINEHQAEHCEPMEAALDHITPAMRGREFYCTCPYGRHGFYMLLEGESSDQVIRELPPELLMGHTRTEQVEVFVLPG